MFIFHLNIYFFLTQEVNLLDYSLAYLLNTQDQWKENQFRT